MDCSSAYLVPIKPDHTTFLDVTSNRPHDPNATVSIAHGEIRSDNLKNERGLSLMYFPGKERL